MTSYAMCNNIWKNGAIEIPGYNLTNLHYVWAVLTFTQHDANSKLHI